MNNNFLSAGWIRCASDVEGESVVLYKKSFSVPFKPKKAELFATACGVYSAHLNGKKVSMPMAPGFDNYEFRIPYNVYNVTDCVVFGDNDLQFYVGRGWYCWFVEKDMPKKLKGRFLKAALVLTGENGEEFVLKTDGSFLAFDSKCLYSDIYNGETFDAVRQEVSLGFVKEVSLPDDKILALHGGEKICECERFPAKNGFVTKKGEYVVDFGQEITGYVEISIPDGAVKRGDEIELSHAEILDKFGNFYNENYRGAKAKLRYVCCDGAQEYKPLLTFFGFRYVRLDKKPNGVNYKNFTAVAVHSALKRTGYIDSSSPLLNKFVENVFWGQKDNFLDIPTDCPQRDERQGWTGDAQVFCRAANYNFDCEKFYSRWLETLRFEQLKSGYVPTIVPNSWGKGSGFSAAWSDAATVVPWELFRFYGNEQLLEKFFSVMCTHVEAITKSTTTRYLWTGGEHFGDWLALDSNEGDGYHGSSNRDFIASAFYARSTELTVKAGNALGKNVKKLQELYKKIRAEFIKTYLPETQTECVLALYFGLTDDKNAVIEKLVKKIKECGNHLQTGFVGTPYLLHALSQNGRADLAYELLLREEFPSWLYSVKCGATTVWEHWDGCDEKGNLWSPDMNSFNHYAYGSVVDWIYGVCAGISPEEAGYKKIKIQPVASKRLEYLNVKYISRYGEICVFWKNEKGGTRYYISVPSPAEVVINGEKFYLSAGEKFEKFFKD